MEEGRERGGSGQGLGGEKGGETVVYVCNILRKRWDRMQNHLKSLLFQFSLPISHPTTRQIFNLRENNIKATNNSKADCT